MKLRLSIFAAFAVALTGAAQADTISSTDARTRANDPRELYVYPAKGQSPEQLDRDRYDCHLWAVRQTGFDPSVAQSSAPQRRERTARETTSRTPETAENVMRGAVAGAIIGSAVSSPRERSEGAIVGATAGAVIGAAASQAGTMTVTERERRVATSTDPRASSYTRALSACLEGRGYTVR